MNRRVALWLSLAALFWFVAGVMSHISTELSPSTIGVLIWMTFLSAVAAAMSHAIVFERLDYTSRLDLQLAVCTVGVLCSALLIAWTGQSSAQPFAYLLGSNVTAQLLIGSACIWWFAAFARWRDSRAQSHATERRQT